jgi:hypothetical protein
MNPIPFLQISIALTFLRIPYKKTILRFYPQNVCAYHSAGKFTRIILVNGKSFTVAMSVHSYENTIAGYGDFLIKAQQEAIEKVQAKREIKDKLKIR